MAIDGGVAVQDVPYATLRERLLKDGQDAPMRSRIDLECGLALKLRRLSQMEAGGVLVSLREREQRGLAERTRIEHDVGRLAG